MVEADDAEVLADEAQDEFAGESGHWHPCLSAAAIQLSYVSLPAACGPREMVAMVGAKILNV